MYTVAVTAVLEYLDLATWIKLGGVVQYLVFYGDRLLKGMASWGVLIV